LNTFPGKSGRVLLVVWLLVAVCMFWARPASAEPLHDGFLEDFQVGMWSKPTDVILDFGYPMGVLRPAKRDSLWLAAAEAVLADCRSGEPTTLTGRLWRRWADTTAAPDWLGGAEEALADFAAGRPGNPAVAFLWQERLAVAFDRALAAGDLFGARAMAGRILAEAEQNDLPAAAVFVWSLRKRALDAQGPKASVTPETQIWREMAALGPYDVQNAWAVWVAHRRGAAWDVLPPGGDQVALGDLLGRLGRAWLSPTEIQRSGLSLAYQSGLGAVLLPTADLRDHFKRFSRPPQAYRLQGWWVRGQRRLRRGQAGSYEQLAVRPGLSPGWRLDVWRRASELRILRGAWVEGLADLDEALQLAEAGHGTAGQRLRLRQWVVQALVLCLARDDLGTARRLARLGRHRLQGEDLVGFKAAIEPWHREIFGGMARTGDGSNAIAKVRGGLSPVLSQRDTAARRVLQGAATEPPWLLWARWGRGLATVGNIDDARRKAAVRYDDTLRLFVSTESESERTDLVLDAVSRRLVERPWAPQLLRAALAADVGRLCGWQTAPRRSLVPSLLPAVRRSQLDAHALLGFCQLMGDMRGIVGLATEIPARGLTTAEKRRFLYPLPAAGPILDAVVAAENEPGLLLAIARNESLYDPAVRSRAGALGWMQIMPFHYPGRGAAAGAGNWRLPAVSVARGDGLLVETRRRYRGDPYRTVAAYNAGPTAVDRWDRQLGGAASRDLFLAWIGYPETRSYVEKVLVDREIYRAIIGALSGATSSHGNPEGLTAE